MQINSLKKGKECNSTLHYESPDEGKVMLGGFLKNEKIKSGHSKQRIVFAKCEAAAVTCRPNWSPGSEETVSGDVPDFKSLDHDAREPGLHPEVMRHGCFYFRSICGSSCKGRVG